MDTAVAETTAKVRKPVTEKTLSCLSIQTGAGVTTEITIRSRINSLVVAQSLEVRVGMGGKREREG